MARDTVPAATSIRPRRNVLADDVYEAVKAVIMDHDIEPGQRVGIDQLARDFDVSPTPIREALARLEAERLVIKEPLRGYRAAPLLTPEELTELFEFRRMIEPWAAARAATSIGADQRRALEAELATVDAPDGHRYDSYRDFVGHDERFHRILLDAAGNDLAARTYRGLHIHLHLFRLHFGVPHAAPAIAEHRAVADAILRGASDDAAAAATHHLDHAHRRLVDAIAPAP